MVRKCLLDIGVSLFYFKTENLTYTFAIFIGRLLSGTWFGGFQKLKCLSGLAFYVKNLESATWFPSSYVQRMYSTWCGRCSQCNTHQEPAIPWMVKKPFERFQNLEKLNL